MVAAAQPQAARQGDTAPRAGYCPSPTRAPGPWSWATAQPLGKLELLYQPCCPPFRRPPGADPGARGRPSVPARAVPRADSRDRPRSTDLPPFDRGRPASDPGAAARAEAEPMERSAASQLATATRRSLQPPSCPLLHQKRLGAASSPRRARSFTRSPSPEASGPPLTSSPSERLFSTAGNQMTKKRCCLTCHNLETLVYLHEVWPKTREWVRLGSSQEVEGGLVVSLNLSSVSFIHPSLLPLPLLITLPLSPSLDQGQTLTVSIPPHTPSHRDFQAACKKSKTGNKVCFS